MIINDLIRPSGGLYYHIRAAGNQKRWRPFTNDLAAALAAWPCCKNELLLFGPSAGYSLPTPWLSEFSRLIAFDLDPLAGFLFRRRHPGLNIRFEREDLFWRSGRLTCDKIDEILKRHPEASILFCNVLGQIHLEGPVSDVDWQNFLLTLRKTLKGRHWASYHDLYSHTKHQVIDHLLDTDWSADLKRHNLEWQLTASQRHHVQFVWEFV